MSEQRSEAGAGWVTFAGIILIVVGIFQAFAGLVGILEDEIMVLTPDYLVQLDATTWGWVHMIIGLIVIASGFGIFSGNVLARTVGVFAAIGRRRLTSPSGCHPGQGVVVCPAPGWLRPVRCSGTSRRRRSRR